MSLPPLKPLSKNPLPPLGRTATNAPVTVKVQPLKQGDIVRMDPHPLNLSGKYRIAAIHEGHAGITALVEWKDRYDGIERHAWVAFDDLRRE